MEGDVNLLHSEGINIDNGLDFQSEIRQSKEVQTWSGRRIKPVMKLGLIDIKYQ